jgi:ATPase subunit of ABC transporter with duplicated ATPase domains
MNKITKKTLIKFLACYLMAALFVMGTIERSYAGYSPSEIIKLSAEERVTDLAKVRAALETKMVSEKLKQLGFNNEEIQSRLGQLSDAQLHRLALKTDEMRVGGDGFGVVIAVLAIAFLVVLFLYVFKRV